MTCSTVANAPNTAAKVLNSGDGTDKDKDAFLSKVPQLGNQASTLFWNEIGREHVGVDATTRYLPSRRFVMASHARNTSKEFSLHHNRTESLQ